MVRVVLSALFYIQFGSRALARNGHARQNAQRRGRAEAKTIVNPGAKVPLKPFNSNGEQNFAWPQANFHMIDAHRFFVILSGHL
jgi:hypothetical protein